MNYPVSNPVSLSRLLQFCLLLLLFALVVFFVTEIISFFRLFEVPLVLNPAMSLMR